jgi:hypothetical protein
MSIDFSFPEEVTFIVERVRRFCDEVVGWRERLLDVGQLALAREGFAHSFGSCSFDEPVQDLTRRGLL